MQTLRSLIGSVNAPRASRWLLATATVLLTAWLQAHILLAAVHDDGSTARNAIAVYNSGDVRDQVSGAVDWALQTGGELSGSGAALAPVQAAIATVLDSGQISAPVADALVGALILLRDDALTQFATDGPTQALNIDLAPLLGAFGIPVTPELTTALGTAASTELVLPLADAQTVDTLRTRYRMATIVDRWGLVAAAVLALAGIILSRRPVRTLAIALSLTGAASLVALPLFDLLTGWLLVGGAGAWSPLIAPLVESAVAQLRPWLVPIGIGALIAGAAVGAAWFLRERRRAAASGATSVSTDDQPERATRPSTPWTNEPESSVENSLASSTASSIATPAGTSSL